MLSLLFSLLAQIEMTRRWRSVADVDRIEELKKQVLEIERAEAKGG